MDVSKGQTKFASSRHTIVCFNGAIWVFGDNSFGQLGLGHTIAQLKPVKLDKFYNNKFGLPEEKSEEAKVLMSAADVIAVRAGCNHSAFLTTHGLYMCGLNDSGQLGLGDTQDRHTPVRLLVRNEQREAVEVLDVALGSHHTLVRTARAIYSFGCNKQGQLGLGDTTMRIQPTLVREVMRQENKGGHFSPRGKNSNHSNEDEREREREREREAALLSFPRDIACGAAHSLVLSRGGLFACGANAHGQLGLGHTAGKWFLFIYFLFVCLFFLFLFFLFFFIFFIS
jgi:alpha-tubulin suppressor-like RCC1 family protein